MRDTSPFDVLTGHVDLEDTSILLWNPRGPELL